ncbi:MAG: DUF3891 family protein, partial [Planctomycetales bacterium]|nr:DUF3891 family protein [Planctomycetales bacterium]
QYVAGIDQIGLTDPYAALLCSRHYASFFPSDRLAALGADAARFVAGERSRQEGLKDALAHSGRTAELQRADPDLALLKLWDHLSLYVALN